MDRAVTLYYVLTIPIHVYFLITSICNYIYARRTRAPMIHNGPKVSVLIPARNEANNIERCLRSLATQSYSNYEVHVMDDNSEDGTYKLAGKIAIELEGITSIHVHHSKELPNGWYGKTYAMQQLVEHSKGEIILFTDADTIHNHDSVSYMVSALLHQKCDLVSGFPRQMMNSLGEKLTVPTMYMIKLLIPFFLIPSVNVPQLSFAIGQYICIRRRALKKVGNLKPVRNLVCEDLYLAEHLKRLGCKMAVVKACHVVTCRMYNNYTEAFDGLAKSVIPTLRYDYLIVLTCYAMFYVILYPSFAMISSLITFNPPSVPVLTCILLAQLAWAISVYVERTFSACCLLYPLYMFTSMAMLTYSVWNISIVGKGFIWKGRRVI